MKRKYLWLAIGLLTAIESNALIVNVSGYGDIPADGLEITVDEALEDPLTGQMFMGLQGSLLCSAPLSVTITRSKSGLTDEFCCAGQCTAGNGGNEEHLEFNPDGVAAWYTHYNPEPDSEVTIEYNFSDGADTRVLTVHYSSRAQGLHPVSGQTTSGIIYTLTGTYAGTEENRSALPDGIYILNGKTFIKTTY